MFERYLTDALTTHFGHVIENLDSDKVRISAWNGELVLSDLSLRPTALDSFINACPVEISYGNIGNLELRIPWKLFRSNSGSSSDGDSPSSSTAASLISSCQIVLSDVDILITPRRVSPSSADDDGYDEADTKSPEETRVQKEKRIQAAIDAGLLQRVTKSSIPSARWKWIQEWLSEVLASLSVTITNIHVRYEDPGTSMGFSWRSDDNTRRYRPSFSVGVTLSEFSIRNSKPSDKKKDSTDKDNDDEVAVMKAPPFRYKAADARQLAIYWESDCKLMSESVTPAESRPKASEQFGSMFRIMSKTIFLPPDGASRPPYGIDRTYLLDPISPHVQLKLRSKPQQSTPDSSANALDESSNDSLDSPRSQLNSPSSVSVDLSECKITIARNTLEDIVYLRKSISVWSYSTKSLLSNKTIRRLGRIRPKLSPSNDPKAWWHYSFEATMILSRVNRDGKDLEHIDFYRKRRRGWLGLVDALRRRQQYLLVYADLILSDANELQQKLHEKLLVMEDELLDDEIASFRLALYNFLKEKNKLFSPRSKPQTRWKYRKDQKLPIGSSNEVLSLDHRLLMIDEMFQAFRKEEENNTSQQLAAQSSVRCDDIEESILDSDNTDMVVVAASFSCQRLSVQVNDRQPSRRSVPVVCFSSSILYRQSWYDSGSWDSDCSLSSILAKDLIGAKLKGRFPHLISFEGTSKENACVSISIRRRLHWRLPDGQLTQSVVDRGSTTTTKVRVIPLVVVYSTLPVEALSRVLAAVKSPELVGDYHRMASAAYEWRNRQKMKFLKALAHAHKRVLFDFDIGSPEFLVPEDETRIDSPMLSFHLGRLLLSNAEDEEGTNVHYDDVWRLSLRDIQVKCMTIQRYLTVDGSDKAFTENSQQRLVEPFSVDLTAHTKVASSANDRTRVDVSATLPRLAFNITTSATRLILRLQNQFIKRRVQATVSRSGPESLPMHRGRSAEGHHLLKSDHETSSYPNGGTSSSVLRSFDFHFSAPLISLRVENDVDGRNSRQGGRGSTTPLLDLSFRGIQGGISKEWFHDGKFKTNFKARLHSLFLIDLYQKAGKGFALLMSSVSPDAMEDSLVLDENRQWSIEMNEETERSRGDASSPDLVMIEFNSRSQFAVLDENPKADKLSITFHELFAEWNPETLAGVQKAIRIPRREDAILPGDVPGEDGESESSGVESLDDIFFDAHEEEDEFFDAGSETDSVVKMMSEISMSPSNYVDERDTSKSPYNDFWNLGALGVNPSTFTSNRSLLPPWMEVQKTNKHPLPDAAFKRKPFEVSFTLSKVLVNFNKEVRHRRVMTAQMDGTVVNFKTHPKGGSNTNISIGNLLFLDPSQKDSGTLFGQVVGMQPDFGSSTGPSSLLEMEITLHPKVKEFSSISDDKDNSRPWERNVLIDRQDGTHVGCNTFIRASFSPMRFVFLEQLWLEIVDYFFEGIIGSEVWGTVPKRKVLEQLAIRGRSDKSGFLPGSDAQGFNFTRFDISLESPEVLLPVTYRSTHFIKLDLESLRIRNHHTCDTIEQSGRQDIAPCRMQWFNNCHICLQSFQIFSWCGRQLSRSAIEGDVNLKWPVGLYAPTVVPKWNVDLKLGKLDVSLRRSDYALFQHFIAYNVGELSRNLDEWEVLSSLSPQDINSFKEKIMVHFGYDNKDVAPTTFNICLDIPSIDFVLMNEDTDEPSSESTLAIIRCIGLNWQLTKVTDRVSRQRAAFDAEIVAPGHSLGFEKVLSLNKYDSDQPGNDPSANRFSPELVYTSTTRPTGENVKTLEITGATIYAAISAWKNFVGFFRGLPEPEILTRQDVAESIQVGDRWYKIGGSTFTKEPTQGSPRRRSSQFSWVADFASDRPTLQRKRSESVGFLNQKKKLSSSQLRVVLTSPQIILRSPSADGITNMVILQMNHLDYFSSADGALENTTKSFFVHELELYTSSSKRSSRRKHGENSLFHPWSVVGLLETTAETPDAQTQTTLRINSNILEARAAYSDMTLAFEVFLAVFYNAKGGAASSTVSPPPEAQKRSGGANPMEYSDGSEDQELPRRRQNVEIQCDGFNLLVMDDSGRHFAASQELLLLSLGNMSFSQERDPSIESIRLSIYSIDLFDCLQPVGSPFRLAASSRTGATGGSGSGNVSKEDEAEQPILKRDMLWEELSVQSCTEWGFEISASLLQMLSNEDRGVHENTGHGGSELIHLHREISEDTVEYGASLRSLELQWNPSTVIAIQRFLGRIRKDSKANVQRIFDSSFENMIGSSAKQQPNPRLNDNQDSQKRVWFDVEIHSVMLCLNKEHQNRRLLEVSLLGCHFNISVSSSGMIMDGRLGDLQAFDSDNYEEQAAGKQTSIILPNRNVIRSFRHSTEKSLEPSMDKLKSMPLVHVQYRTFKGSFSTSTETRSAVPDWVGSLVDKTGSIDDFLSIDVSSLEIVFLRERTLEVIDYLSNGLPGKGMGATSRAAQGFISKRILSKSFLYLHVKSPRVLIPQHESATCGMMLELGNLAVKSWFEEGNSGDHLDHQSEWWRILSLSIAGLQGGMFYGGAEMPVSPVSKPIDLSLTLRKPTVKGQEMKMRGKLSFVTLTLKYTDYVLLRAVARDNLVRPVDRDRWDNVEKAYWMEEERSSKLTPRHSSSTKDGEAVTPTSTNRVTYSSHARFVRYGKKSKGQNGGSTVPQAGRNGFLEDSDVSPGKVALDFSYELDGLSVRLSRDDEVVGLDQENLKSEFHYDIILLKVQLVEITLNTNSNGSKSFHLSLYRIGLFDLGDSGRLLRESYYSNLQQYDSSSKKPASNKKARLPCPFSVLAEGYAGQDLSSSERRASDDPQLVVSIDRCPASNVGSFGSTNVNDVLDESEVTVARVVVNFLSVNALIRPLREVLDFMACTWPVDNIFEVSPPSTIVPVVVSPMSDGAGDSTKIKANPLSVQSGLRVTIVAHYPRVFFLADESDPKSRALVLRGLAVLNGSKYTKVLSASGAQISEPQEEKIVNVDAQLQSMESYINPDVSEALLFSSRHIDMVGEDVSAFKHITSYQDVVSRSPQKTGDDLGVALIQPVTAGLEYSQTRKELFPTRRRFFINIDPISTMLSFEDLELIESILKRFSTGKRKRQNSVEMKAPDSSDGRFTVSFDSSRLGLGLKMERNKVLVEDIENPKYMNVIHAGDRLYAIADQKLDDLCPSLPQVVRLLTNSERPLVLTFQRDSLRPQQSQVALRRETSENRNEEDAASVDDSVELISSFELKLRVGIPHGLIFEKSPCGTFTVVSDVSEAISNASAFDTVDESNADQIETINTFGEEIRVPRIGAILACIDDTQTDELGHSDLLALLDSLTGMNQSDCERRTACSNDSYTLTFLEMDSSIWGNVDVVDVSADGISLSFIDDLNGRDMPLLRGELSQVEAHIERGVGVEASILDMSYSNLLSLARPQNEFLKALPGLEEVCQSISSDSISTFSAILLCNFDYYHPKIAVWEPLIEPSRFFLLVENQQSNEISKRPGQTAFEISDSVLREQKFGRKLPFQMSEPYSVSLNLSDAAATVFVNATSRWRSWRKALVASSTLDSEEPDNAEANTVNVVLPNIDFDGLSAADTNNTLSSTNAGAKSSARQMATQRAAQAALTFAQKRGAETNTSSQSAKPFVFRNRTGVSVAFVSQEAERSPQLSNNTGLSSHADGIGEYRGLDGYEKTKIKELSDQEESKFNMDMISDTAASVDHDERSGRNKVRNYEGRFPSLTVSFQAVAGVSIDPVENLQVMKVGSFVRYLSVRKESDQNSNIYSIPIVWKVELEDNRRILTLSGAVRLISAGFESSIEVGTQCGKESEFISVGIARPNSPLYLPLWLALKLEPVSVVSRPCSLKGDMFTWSEPILKFELVEDAEAESKRWIWRECFEEVTYIRCKQLNGAPQAVWLACFDSSPRAFVGSELSLRRKSKKKRKHDKEDLSEVISVTLDACLTIRNMLPIDLEWEVATCKASEAQSRGENSLPRPENRSGKVHPENPQFERHPHPSFIGSGECKEVLSVETKRNDVALRFRGLGDKIWSTWADLEIGSEKDMSLEEKQKSETASTEGARIPATRQINVQIIDDVFGTPTTLGVRAIPKTTRTEHVISLNSVYGLEVVVYAELWIKNLTNLPLNFGCPAYQMHESGYNGTDPIGFSEQSAARFTAESALMEIASVLEFGDKGTGFSKKTTKELVAGGIVQSLPNQVSKIVAEEVFEYVEVDQGEVKRRWWAAESYDSYRENITQISDEGPGWHWIDEKWCIDTTGNVNVEAGGWESCRNLLGGSPFAASRGFDPSHKFRRRRWFRRRTTYSNSREKLRGGLQVFHQPLDDSFSQNQRKLKQKRSHSNDNTPERMDKDISGDDTEAKIAVKKADGKWSFPASIPSTGTCYGAVRVVSSRWPSVTKVSPSSPTPTRQGVSVLSSPQEKGAASMSPYIFRKSSLDPELSELCYKVTDLEGEWGEFSRAMIFSARFLLRNDSKRVTFQVKQAGAADDTAVTLPPGEVRPFYWADFRLPGLASIRPISMGTTKYRWSGGFDVSNLGMAPIRVRSKHSDEKDTSHPFVHSVRALVEIRPGTGGFGLNLSFKEEDPSGDGALFRIENNTTFPLWFSQDGLVANPTTSARGNNERHQRNTDMDGDMISPSSKVCYALDVPYRQGKYAHRKAATMPELLRLRVALAPMGSRAGIESVKVIGLTEVGRDIRLNPGKLGSILPVDVRQKLHKVRILGVISNDGPTRVLEFCFMEYSDSDLVFGNPFVDASYMSTNPEQAISGPKDIDNHHNSFIEIIKGAQEASERRAKSQFLAEEQVKRKLIFRDVDDQNASSAAGTFTGQEDRIFSFRAAFSGFTLSFIDSIPSEIALASLKNVNALARWNALRSSDASLIVSVGWLQVDNHIPSAPFPVAVRPDTSTALVSTEENSEIISESQVEPLLMGAFSFAPKHKSGIVCLRTVTIAPRNLIIAVDLAFLVRIHRFAVGVMNHFQHQHFDSANLLARNGASMLHLDQKRMISFPDMDKYEHEIDRAAESGVQNQKLYFEGLTILPCNIILSVAPARALTAAQANLEGKEAAAIHQAVRKGDVLVGSSNTLLGVKVGRRNATALAVVRGVFKSIVVDALLRLDGAALNFSGVVLRNHVSTIPQLSTYLMTHYMASLRQNLPALLGSLAAFGNPLGLIRGIGDGVTDFVAEPVKGLKRSVEELNPSFLVDGVARGTGSLARHTVGGFADSASLLTETFSKNMAVLTLDRRYAQKRDRGKSLRRAGDQATSLVSGVESGFIKLFQGFADGVTGVVKAPIRGAERRGIEGFAKGIGKGLLGLLVKPIIGISDAATDVMIGVKSTVDSNAGGMQSQLGLQNQIRPRRPMYGHDKVLRPYRLDDAAAAVLMLQTQNAGENYLSHVEMGDRVALLSVKRLLIVGSEGQELLVLKYKHVERLDIRPAKQEDGNDGWAIVVLLNTPRRNGSEIEVITCSEKSHAVDLCAQIKHGMNIAASENL